ncbi:MAG TPA: hypothetical protein VGI39_19835, partial [Polyangiaceae bacterium]
EGRKVPWTDAAKVKSLAEEAKLAPEDATTAFGNALAVLERGPEDGTEQALARALWAHAVAEAPPKGREDEDRAATDILWLATHTPFDATPLLDRALGDAASEIWDAITDRIRRVDQGKLANLGRGEALVGCVALARSSSPSARRHAASLAGEIHDPAFKQVLEVRAPIREETLHGELVMTPRGPVATTVLAITGLLFAYHGVRLLARLALAYRRPAELTLSETGVHIHVRVELLGRLLRERDHVILRNALVEATREVRYPRLPFYVGLLALATGSYFGVATLLDGVRAASPSLLLTGLLVVAAGVLLEVLFGSLEPATTGRCRVLLVPARGPAFCVGQLEPRRTDQALQSFAKNR